MMKTVSACTDRSNTGCYRFCGSTKTQVVTAFAVQHRNGCYRFGGSINPKEDIL